MKGIDGIPLFNPSLEGNIKRRGEQKSAKNEKFNLLTLTNLSRKVKVDNKNFLIHAKVQS